MMCWMTFEALLAAADPAILLRLKRLLRVTKEIRGRNTGKICLLENIWYGFKTFLKSASFLRQSPVVTHLSVTCILTC